MYYDRLKSRVRTVVKAKQDASAPHNADTDMEPSILMLTMLALLEISAAKAAKIMGRA